ncbi:putative Ac68-like protein [Esparto virus]|uniref:Putative Ac68-like protein n=1 Tax=Esparto virus TaxID=2072209 RepID=A0A2I7G2Z8_9VIRU|nr:putative Ac68-like protein [Esparto virus]AUQ44018.1 putative Ac68-like protein [Esparto virus]
MKLTLDEFNLIRPLQWTLVNYGNKVYNTTVDQIETQLFWLDFIRLIFAPKYKLQVGITSISNFDQTQPVLLTDDLELFLPTQLETAMYFANNQKSPPMRYALNINQLIILIIGIILMIILFISKTIVDRFLPIPNMI